MLSHPLCPRWTECERGKGRRPRRKRLNQQPRLTHGQSGKEDSRTGTDMLRVAFWEITLDGQPGVSLPYPDHVTHASASQRQPRPLPWPRQSGPHTASLPVGGLSAGTAPAAPGPRHPLWPGALLWRLTNGLPPSPAPPAPQPLQRGLISGTGGRPGPRLSAFTARSTARGKSLHGFNGV